jgi:hypothetical protein
MKLKRKKIQQASQYLPLAGRSQYRLAGTFHGGRSRLMKIVFFRQVMDKRIQMKKPGFT